MLTRKAVSDFESWVKNGKKKALIILGARQVGKSYLVDALAPQHFANVVKFDLVENPSLLKSFEAATSADDLFMRMSSLATQPMVEGETLVFVDEVQECPNIITFAKSLVQNTKFRYVFSGSLLGARLENIDSIPVGYATLLEMHPLDFEEFCWAAGMTQSVTKMPVELVESGQAIPDYLHERFLQLFKEYLIVGGMPEAVNAFFETKNIQEVRSVQQQIEAFYIMDITKYAPKGDRLKIRQIYSLIPSELATKAKRFRLNSIKSIKRYSQVEAAFLWLQAASVAIAANQADEPCPPLLLTQNNSKLKLFMLDVGMLASHYLMSAAEILDDAAGLNMGAIYENFVAQQLVAAGVQPFYFSSKKIGELDFVIEPQINRVVMLEVKSGKSFKTHKALDNALAVKNWKVSQAIVLSTANYSSEGRIEYMPVYLVGLGLFG